MQTDIAANTASTKPKEERMITLERRWKERRGEHVFQVLLFSCTKLGFSSKKAVTFVDEVLQDDVKREEGMEVLLHLAGACAFLYTEWSRTCQLDR